jgi:hypothetical protein
MLPADVSVLQQPVLSLDMSALHKHVLQLQPELPLDLSVLQQPPGFEPETHLTEAGVLTSH